MSLPAGETPFDCVEIRFKNGSKEFYRNTEKLTLSIGDVVATEASPGHDVGIVTLTSELVKIQMRKKGIANKSNEVPKIYRKASLKDIDIGSESRNKEEKIQVKAREIAIALKLEMKISDIEFQGDGSKITFYYTANDRVDFRQLIKEYAQEFKTRIEMKQVGFRQEASRLGGIGSCGRELCCSTFVFIRHHTVPEEVDEDNFFHSRETGGTIVSSALKLMQQIINERYASSSWNIYGAQASDGDNWNDDSPVCRELLSEKILPLMQYFAYIEITEGEPQNLWDEYEKLATTHAGVFALQRIAAASDIYPVFRELFRKRLM